MTKFDLLAEIGNSFHFIAENSFDICKREDFDLNGNEEQEIGKSQQTVSSISSSRVGTRAEEKAI